MAFNINAQVILSGPKNLGKISKQIQTSLGKSGAIKVKIDPSSLRNIKILNSTVGTLNTNIASLNSSASKLQSTLSGVNSNLSKASSATSSFSKSQSNTASSIKNVNNALQQQNQQLGNLGKRFLSTAKTAVAFGLISRPIYDLQRAFIGATKDAVAFEREIVKISQVTGQTVKQLGNLRSDINRLSTSLGISANELAETARIIAQTGQSAENTRVILEALSRSTLAPTFGKITDTTEGLVAALGQFNLGAKDSEAILGALNRVSKNFAVEAEDLISVIRRTGGVFAQAAGDSRNTIGALEELIAIFTAVRSTTRESADTIAAGLRTIFSRIQRRGTIEFLEQFNIQLTNAKGQFIGVFPAFDELSRKLDTLIRQGDALTLSAIAEELGGIRQIGKLLPAIAQFDKARSALEQAQKGAVEGLGSDVDKALNTIDNRIKRVRESFSELIRTVFESPAFQQFAKTVLTLSETFLNFGTTIAKAIEPILPLLATLGAVKLGNIAAGFIGGGGLGKVAGAASTVTGQATASNTAQVAAAAQQSVSIEQQMLSVLNQVSTQLSNIFSLQSADNKLRNNQLSNIFQAINQQAARSAAPTVVGGFGGPRRRASGGQIYGFNRGGMVPGTGNRDTVPAMLTPGEFVIKKSSVESIGAGNLAAMNFNKGGKARGGGKGKGRRAYVFDFDDTLGVSGSSGKELFSSDPQLAAARQDKLRNARATSLANSARKRSQQGYDVHVLTARFGSPQDEAALKDFLTTAGIKPGRTIFTGGLFKGEREPGKRPGTTRQLSTATKKARILEQLAAQYESILFLDDAIENVVKAKGVKGVTPIAVDKKTQGLRRRFNTGGEVTAKVRNPKQFGAFIAKQGGSGAIAPDGRAIDSGPFQKFKDTVKRAIESQSQTRIVSDNEIDKELKKQESNFFTTKGKLSSGGKDFIRSSELGATGITLQTPEQQRSLVRQGIEKKLSQPTVSPTLRDQEIKSIKIQGPFPTFPIAGEGELNQALQPDFKAAAEASLAAGTRILADSEVIRNLNIEPGLKGDKQKIFDSYKSFFKGARESLEGFLLEGVIGGLTNATISGGFGRFDFPALDSNQKAKDRLQTLFGNDAGIQSLRKADAKRQQSTATDGDGRLVNKIASDGGLNANQISIIQRNKGGGISGQDTVPALLTPGEFVFNKKAASRIGYGNLNRMNKDGVQGFNKGGPVGIQRFANGSPGGVKPTGGAGLDIGALSGALFSLQFAFQDVANLFSGEGQTFGSVLQTLITVGTSLAFTLQAINAQQLAQGFGNLLGGIKKLPSNLKGINKSVTNFGKRLQSNKGFTGRFSSFTKTDKLLGKGANKFGSFLNKLPKGQLINKAGASVIGKVLAAGVAGPIAAAFTAIPIGKFVGDAVGNSLDKAIFGAREEAGGFQGREGQGAGSAAASGAVREGLGGAGVGAGIGAVLGGPIGAAIGAAIGAGAGAIVGAINGPLEQASFEAAKKLQKDTEELGKSLEQFVKSGSIADFDTFLDDFLAQGDATNTAFETFTNQFDNQVSLLDFTPIGSFTKGLDAAGKAISGDFVGAANSAVKGLAGSTIAGAIGTGAARVGAESVGRIDVSNLGKSLDDAIKQANPFKGTRLAQIVDTQFGGVLKTLNFKNLGQLLNLGFQGVTNNIKKFGDGITKAADTAFKSFTGLSFGEAKKNIEDGLKKASDVFNQAAITAFRATPIGLVSFLLGPAEAAADSAEGQANAVEEQAKREAQARGKAAKVTKNQIKAVERIQTLIDPKQVEEARKALSQGLQKLVETGRLGVDFEGLDVTTQEGQQEARSRIRAKAQEDSPEGDRARKLLAAESQQITNELSTVSKTLKDGSGTFGFFKSSSQKAGEALDSLNAAVLSGQIDPSNQEEVNAFLSRFGAAGKDAAKEFEKIAESSDGALGAAVNAGLLAKALKEAEKALNTFNAELKTIQDDLAFATESSAVAMSNLKETTDALSNGQILFTQKLDGFDFGKAGAGARQDRIAAIGQATGVNVEGIQKFDTVISNADEIGKDAFEDLKEREKDGKVGLKDVTSALEKGIEKELGFELPEGPLKEGLKKSLEGFGRQLGNGSDIPLDKLGEAIEDGKVAELLGPAFEQVQKTTKALSETFNQLNSIAAEEANLRLKIAQEQIKAQQEVTKRERAIEDTAIDPEKAFKGDPLKLAQKRLDEDIADLGFAGKSAVEIAQAQQVARDKQQELNEKLQSGAISADKFAIQAAEAANENANASAALNQLANDTTQLSAIQQKAAKLIANRDASRKQVTSEIVARETGDVGALARRREQSRLVQSGIADGASQGDRTRLLVAAAQDQSIQEEIALQQRIKDPEGTKGKTTQEIFDETLLQDLESRLATETDPLERARIGQQIEDIKAPGLEDLQKEAVDIQKNQLATQQLIAANQQLLLQAQLAGTEEQKAVVQEKLTANTEKLNNLLQNNEKTAQEQQALNETLEPTPVTTAGADVGSSAAGGVITRGNLGEANAPVLVPLTPSPLVAGNTGFNPTTEQILKKTSGPSPQQQSQQGMISAQDFAAIMQDSLAAFGEKADLIQAAAELQNQASERQLEAANGIPTQIAHNMTPIEINGFADLPRALNEFTNNIGAIAQNMIDPSQQYIASQGDGVRLS